MGKKIYLYDSKGVDFFVCLFDGLDTEGKPRLTIVTPGLTVESFLEHLDYIGEDPNDYFLLCEEGIPADSKHIIEMLGQIYFNSIRPLEWMAERLEKLRMYGISYDRDLQRIRVRMFENKDSAPQGKSYFMEMIVGDTYIGEVDDVKDLDVLIGKMVKFFDYIENRVQIPLRKCLETNESMKKLVVNHSPNYFDEVKIMY